MFIIIFSKYNLGECSDKKVEVIHEIEVNEGVFYGTYKKSSEVINGRAFFEKVDITNDFYKYGIWWACGDRWCIHAFTFRGQCNCIAFNYKNSKCLPKLEDSNWIMRNSKTNVWEYAGKGLIVRALTGMLPEPDSILDLKLCSKGVSLFVTFILQIIRKIGSMLQKKMVQ